MNNTAQSYINKVAVQFAQIKVIASEPQLASIFYRMSLSSTEKKSLVRRLYDIAVGQGAVASKPFNL